MGGVVVKGLAKRWDRLRHDLRVKCVGASLFRVEERLLPNDPRIVADDADVFTLVARRAVGAERLP
jgi:hypothetical protein